MKQIIYILSILFLICIVVVNSKYNNNRDEDYESNINSSIDSGSIELFNVSSKGKTKKGKVSSNFKIKNKTTGSCGKGSKNKDCPNGVENKEGKTLKVRSKLHRYPFSVSIQRKGTHYVSGALIDKKWVLTVAEEFYNVRESIKFFRVRLGTVNCKKGGSLVPIKAVEIHPLYEHKKPSFDVSLLLLATPVEFSEFLKPIPLSKVKGKVLSAKFLATYWPRLIVKGQVLSSSAKERVKPNSMRVSTQKMIPWDWCHSLMTTLNHTLDESSLCLDPIMSHHSPCLPDAGAPVTADDGLWGITSGWTSKHCLSQPSPTLFTRISSPLLESWLDSMLTDH